MSRMSLVPSGKTQYVKHSQQLTKMLCLDIPIAWNKSILAPSMGSVMLVLRPDGSVQWSRLIIDTKYCLQETTRLGVPSLTLTRKGSLTLHQSRLSKVSSSFKGIIAPNENDHQKRRIREV